MKLGHNDIISLESMANEEIFHIFDAADKFEPIARGEAHSNDLNGKILATLFFEPSTRTRLSFESAMKKLGGGVIGFAHSDISSVAKGESLTDTIKTVEKYCDIIVLRHPKMPPRREKTRADCRQFARGVFW